MEENSLTSTTPEKKAPDQAPYNSSTDPIPGKYGRIIRIALVILSVILAVVLVAMILQFRNSRLGAKADAIEAAREQTKVAVNSLNESLDGAMAVVQGVADELSSGSLPFEDVEVRLAQILQEHPRLAGMTVAFAPYAYSSGQRLHTVAVSRDPEDHLVTHTGAPLYDYTLPPVAETGAAPTRWYVDRAELGPSWSEPFRDQVDDKTLIRFGVPFYQNDSDTDEPVLVGVITADTGVSKLQELVYELDLGQTGFGAIISQEGTWLAHPVSERLATGTIYDSQRIQENLEYQNAVESAFAGRPASIETINPISGNAVWDVFIPIESTGWVLLIELIQSQYLPDGQSTLQEVAKILLVAAALLFCLLLLLFRIDRVGPRRLWAASLSFTIIALSIIVILIVLSIRTPADEGILIATQAGLNSYIENLEDEYAAAGLTPPIGIPTGVLVQAARFPDSGSVVVNGYIWQRIPNTAEPAFREGFTLPQMIDEPFQTEEISRQERSDETLVVYSFIAALRQAFDPLEYPFDRHDIRIRMVPQEIQQNAILIPDLESYDFTLPEFLPGVDSDVRINNWRILNSSFRYETQSYRTNLGVPGRPTANVPEMVFNIYTQRRFLGPFVAFLLPALVAAAMIFAFLLYDAKPDEPEEIVVSLSYTAALFFVIAVMHTALRENAAAIGLTYLEYFYLLLYIMVIVVAINTFIVVWRPNYAVVRYGNNLLTKILFWPVVMAVMLLATLYIFIFR